MNTHMIFFRAPTKCLGMERPPGLNLPPRPKRTRNQHRIQTDTEVGAIRIPKQGLLLQHQAVRRLVRLRDVFGRELRAAAARFARQLDCKVCAQLSAFGSMRADQRYAQCGKEAERGGSGLGKLGGCFQMLCLAGA